MSSCGGWFVADIGGCGGWEWGRRCRSCALNSSYSGGDLQWEWRKRSASFRASWPLRWLMGLIRRPMDPGPSPWWFETSSFWASNEAICCMFYCSKKTGMVLQGGAVPMPMTCCSTLILLKPSTKKIHSDSPPGSQQMLGSAPRQGHSRTSHQRYKMLELPSQLKTRKSNTSLTNIIMIKTESKDPFWLLWRLSQSSNFFSIKHLYLVYSYYPFKKVRFSTSLLKIWLLALRIPKYGIYFSCWRAELRPWGSKPQVTVGIINR